MPSLCVLGVLCGYSISEFELNPGYETTAGTLARRRAPLAGFRLGKKLKARF